MRRLNGFDALTAFDDWDGTAAALVPRLEGLDQAITDMLDSFRSETEAQSRKLGASVLALLRARSNVLVALEEAKAGKGPDPVAVAGLVGSAGGAMFWGLAIDARHGIELREKGHRTPQTDRNMRWAYRANELKAEGHSHNIKKLCDDLEAEGKFHARNTVKAGVRKGREALKLNPGASSEFTEPRYWVR